MNKTKVTTRKGSKSKSKKESPEVFVLPPNLLEKLGIHLGNYGSTPESTVGSQVTDSNVITNGSKHACKKVTDSHVTKSSEIESSIIETAELMKKSVFLSPTFISNNTSVIQGEIEIVGNAETEAIETSNVETPSSNPTSLFTLESIQCDLLANGNVEMNDVQMQTLLDDHADEAYSSDCSNSNMGCTPKSELKSNQNKINIISEQIILPSQFYKLKSNYSSIENSLIHVSLNTMISENNNQVSIPQNDLNVDSIPNVTANIVPTEITVVNECDMHGQHFVEGDTNLSMEDDEILQNINKIDLCAMLNETESEFIITTRNQEVSQQDLEVFQDPHKNDMITKDDVTMETCIVMPCIIDVDNGSDSMNNSSDKAVKEAFKTCNKRSYFDESKGENIISGTMSNESKSDILIDIHKNSSTSCDIKGEKESNLQTEDITSDGNTYKEVLPTKKEFKAPELYFSEQPSILENGEIDSVNYSKSPSLSDNNGANQSVLENPSENVHHCQRRSGANTTTNEPKCSSDTLEMKKNKNNPVQKTSTSPIFYVRGHKKSKREYEDITSDGNTYKEVLPTKKEFKAPELYSSEHPSILENGEIDSVDYSKSPSLSDNNGANQSVLENPSENVHHCQRRSGANTTTNEPKCSSDTLEMKKNKNNPVQKTSTSPIFYVRGHKKSKPEYNELFNDGGKQKIKHENSEHHEIKISNTDSLENKKLKVGHMNKPSVIQEDKVREIAKYLSEFADMKKRNHFINRHKMANSKSLSNKKDTTSLKLSIEGVEKPGGSKVNKQDKHYPPVKTYGGRCIQRRKTIPSYVFKDSNKSTESINLTDSISSNNSCHDMEHCLCDDFGRLKSYDDVSSYEHIHFWNNAKTDCSPEIIFSIYSEDASAVDVDNEVMNVLEEYPSETSNETLYKLCWNELKLISDIGFDEGDVGEESELVKHYLFSPEKMSSACADAKVKKKKCNDKQEAEKKVACQNNTMINVNSLQKYEGIPYNKIVPDAHSAKTGQKRKRSIVFSDEGEPPEKNSKRRISKRLSQTKERHTYIDEEQITTNFVKIGPNNASSLKAQSTILYESTALSAKQACGFLSKISDNSGEYSSCIPVNESTSKQFQPTSLEGASHTSEPQTKIPEKVTTHQLSKKGNENKSVTCGVCRQGVKDSYWINHIASQHNYLAWKCGEPSVDVDDETAVKEHLYGITKVYGGLTCAKCGLTRKDVIAYLSHVTGCTGVNVQETSSQVTPGVESVEYGVKKEGPVNTGLVKCGVCGEFIQDLDWNDHRASRHDYLSWKFGEPPLDVNNEAAVRNHLYGIMKACGGLTCAKCGLIRKYVKAYLNHIRNCTGLSEFHNDSAYDVSSEVFPEVATADPTVNAIMKREAREEDSITCGVCQECVQLKEWNHHIGSRHDYLAWKDGEEPLDVNDEVAIRNHLYEIAKTCGGLTCAKCRLTRKYVKAYLSHIKRCDGLNESQNDSTYNVSSNEVKLSAVVNDLLTNTEIANEEAVMTTALVKCAVCEESMQEKDWNSHIAARHDYLAWKLGDTALDVHDETAVRDHLYDITKACGGLTCAKCGLIRKYVKAYLSHVKTCYGPDNSRIESSCNISTDDNSGIESVGLAYDSISKVKQENVPKKAPLVTCAVCEENIQEMDWYIHIGSQHDYLAWRLDEPCLDLNDESAVRNHLYIIANACDGLTCSKCGLTRKYVKSYLSHFKNCNGLSESQNDMSILTEVSGAESANSSTTYVNKSHELLVKCAVCAEYMMETNWNSHIASRHDYLAWKDGEECLDVQDEEAVRQHLRLIKRQNGVLTCAKCGANMTRVKSYLNHVKSKSCQITDLEDSSQNLVLETRAEDDLTLIKCGVCGQYLAKNDWIQHIAANHGYMAWKDGQTPLNSNDEKEVRVHLRSIIRSVGNLSCPKCNVPQKTVKSYVYHIKKCGENQEDMKSTFKCGVCNEIVLSSLWEKHLSEKHDYLAWKDGDTPVNVDDEEDVNEHLYNICNQFGCLFCNKCGLRRKYVKSFLEHKKICENGVIRGPKPKHPEESLDDSVVDFSSSGTCAVCHKEIEAGKWIQHTQKEHNYLAWREGEKPWNLDDFDDLNQYLYVICKRMEGLTCNKCGIVRKYVKTYLTHIKNCDVIDFNLDSSVAEGVGPLNKEVIQCAMCKEQIKRADWKNHAMKKHYNITWIIGETPIDIKNPYAVERYLKEYKQVYGRLKCNVCNASRASFAGFYAHIIVCGKTEEEIDVFRSVCDICNNKYLCIYKNQHAMIHRVQEYTAELKMKKAENSLKLNTEPNISGKRRAAVKARSVIENYSDNMSKHAHSCQSCGFGTDFEDELKTHKCEVSNEKDFSGDESSAAEIGSSDEESGDTDVDSNISNEVNDNEVNDDDDDEDGDGLVVKKKVRHREPVPVLSKVSRIPFKVEDPNSYIRQSDEDFCNTYLTDEVLFPQWRCQLEAVLESEMIHYLPPLEQSCKVKYDSGWKTLSRFEAKKDDNGTSIFVGASIICIAWAPLRVGDIRDGSTNFLAVACHNGPDCPRYQGDETPIHENLIQIWNFSKFERLPQMVLGIAHDFGTVWSMDWCPSGARDALSDGEEVMRRLGLLAVACSSGSAYIFAVPYPSTILKNKQFVHKIKPVAELRMTMGSERKRYQATSVSWSKQKGHAIVLVGYADGSTAYYDLYSTSPLLLTVENDVQVFHPYNDERPHNTCITGTDLYPVSGDAAGSGVGVWTAPTGAELAPRAGAGAPGRARLATAAQAAEFAPHACCAVLGGDNVIMHTAISELAWVPPGRRLGGIRSMAGCARCGRVVASTPPILRIMRPHPAYFDAKKQVVGLLEMTHLAMKRKKQVNDELGMVLEPLTYDDAITKYGISFKSISRTDKVMQHECSAKPKAHCPERFPLADVKSIAFCPSRRYHEKLALATHSGILFLTTIN